MTPKPKKCRVCGTMFTPHNSMQKVCSVVCSLAMVKQEKAKERRSKIREAKQAIKPRGEHMREAQAAFNAFIRYRDRLKSCVSCRKMPVGDDDGGMGGVWDCGHYRSVGAAPELRFNEDNAHKQCKHCNKYLDGNIVQYRKTLIHRIGPERLAEIEREHPALKLTVDDIIEIKRKYRRKLREMQGSR